MRQRVITDVIQALEQQAPCTTAEEWDNVGLLLGDPHWKTIGAIISIDLTLRAIEAAKTRKYRLIITHHPCIFPKGRGICRLTGGPMLAAVSQGIAVATYHTNFDRCALEPIDTIIKKLGAVPKGRLLEHATNSLLKLSVFVPLTHLEKVRKAICKAGAGHIGNYDFCTFGVQGEGTFQGGKNTHPFLGQPGGFEKTQEVRLETVFPRGLEKNILNVLIKTHPYEEVAYDFYPVEQNPTPVGFVRGLGYGFWAEFSSPKLFSELTKDVKNLFKASGFLLTNPPPFRVKRIAFVAGKGGSFMKAAREVGCDLFITGEAGYHMAVESSRKGMAVMELGHRESERFFLTTMSDWLSQLKIPSKQMNEPTQKMIEWRGRK